MRLDHAKTVPFVVGAACGYEAAALLSGDRLPTISSLQFRFRPVGWLVVAWLAYHFWKYQPPKGRHRA